MKKSSKEKLYPIDKQNNEHLSVDSDNKTDTIDEGRKRGIVGNLVRIAALAAAIACAVVFALRLSLDYMVDYVNPGVLELSIADRPMPATALLTEDDIPEKPHIPVYYDFSQPVPECEAVDFSYFDDTVFIGDSRIKGLLMFSKIKPYDFSSVGLNILALQTKAYIRLPNENGEMKNHTLFDALERESGNYKAIYLSTGLNELGWESSSFMYEFEKFILELKKVSDVPIYVQLIIPVTVYSSETTVYGITNQKCFEFNEKFRPLLSELEVFTLDPISLFTLDDGTLDPAHSADGVHLNMDSCKILAGYYQTHIVDIYAYDNTRPTESTAE